MFTEIMTNESEPNLNNHDEPVIIARVGSLAQADVICAVLRTNDIETFIVNENACQNLPHLGLAVHPNGIQIAVRKSDQAEAQLCIYQHNLLDAENERAKSREQNDADRFARIAGVSGIFAILASPLIFVTVWYFSRAIKAERKHSPTDRVLFRRNMILAKVCMACGIILLAGYLVFLFKH